MDLEHSVALATIIRSAFKKVILDTDAKLYHGEVVEVDAMANEAAAGLIDLIDPAGGDETEEILEEAEFAMKSVRMVELHHALLRIIWEETWVTMNMQAMNEEMTPCETSSSYEFVQERTNRIFERITEQLK